MWVCSLKLDRFSPWPRISGCWIPISMLQAVFGMCCSNALKDISRDSILNCSRLGTLFMDLDALAGVIAYRHTGDSVTTVTAAVDRITLLNPLKEICDLELSGQVTYATGRSSTEISLQVAKAPAEGEKVKPEDVLITCAFTMVSLDPATKK